MRFTYRETSHILAALRYIQSNLFIEDFRCMPHFSDPDIEPLTDAEVRDLCERINFADLKSEKPAEDPEDDEDEDEEISLHHNASGSTEP